MKTLTAQKLAKAIGKKKDFTLVIPYTQQTIAKLLVNDIMHKLVEAEYKGELDGYIQDIEDKKREGITLRILQDRDADWRVEK